MSFFDTFSEMLVILFAIAAGYLAHRLGYLGEGVDAKLSKLILNITMPATCLPQSSAPWRRGTLSLVRRRLSPL